MKTAPFPRNQTSFEVLWRVIDCYNAWRDQLLVILVFSSAMNLI